MAVYPLPATGGTWAQVLQPNLNPLNQRYWQIAHILVGDYDQTGVFNLASPSVGLTTGGVWTANGLSTQNLFTPFAADNISIRKDLLVTSSSSPVNLHDVGLAKVDATDWTPDQTVQETESAQFLRTTRNIFTKLNDEIGFTPLESTPLTDALKFEFPLSNLATLGAAQYVAARGNTDILRERWVVMIGIDTDQSLVARVFPRVASKKKGKNAQGRKEVDSQDLSYDILPDPFTNQSMWTVRAGSAWLGAGDYTFETTPPAVTPVTGLKANLVVPTPIDVTAPVYTVQTQLTAGGAFSNATVVGTPSVSGGLTTVVIGSLTASTTYNAAQVTATGSNLTVTTPLSAPFTSTSS